MNGAMPKQEPVRHDFSKIRSYMALPNLIDVQRKSYERFLRSEEHTSELQSQPNLVCRLLLEKNNNQHRNVDLCRRDTIGGHHYCGLIEWRVDGELIGANLVYREARCAPRYFGDGADHPVTAR